MRRTVALDVDDNHSLWAATISPPEPQPALVGDVTADVVIIGAGFTGLSTAYHLAKRYPQKKIVVLEAKRIGNGASGRNGGMALNWIDGVKTKSEEKARRIFEFTKSGLDWIDEMIREHALSVRFRRIGTLECYTDSKRAEEAHGRVETLANWGIPVEYLQGAALAARTAAVGVVGAIHDPTTGQLHGLDFLYGMAGIVRKLGVQICEYSPVKTIEEGKIHKVTTESGTVSAPTLVLATNGYTGRLGYFQNGVFPLHSHVIATEPLPLERWAELGWGNTAGFSDDLDRIAYASMTADGRLLFGGGGSKAYSYVYGSRTAYDKPAPDKFAFVQSILQRYFPGAKDVKIGQQWTGTLGITMSRVCSMGVIGEHKNVFYALGYSGHGVVLANLAGRVLCDLYSDHHEPWVKMPFYQRRLGGIPGEPLRWLGYNIYTGVTGHSPRQNDED